MNIQLSSPPGIPKNIARALTQPDIFYFHTRIFMNIGDRIKQLRTEKNLTQPQLAEAIGIEQSYLSKLENDKSIPSADIFQAILKGLEADVGTFLRGIDEAIIRGQLKQIPEVALYLNAQTSLRVHNIKKWLFSSALACTLGLTLIVAGYKSLLFTAVNYEYSSGGVLKKDEPYEAFEYQDSYLRQKGCTRIFGPGAPTESEECKALVVDLQSRSRLETRLLPEYKGRVMYVDQPDGYRAFIYRAQQSSDSRPNSLIMLVGSFLAFGGLFGFVVEYRLRKI
jgi:transcriptional regulator with XRE-family HTH domain